MIEELAVKLGAEKKEQPKQDTYIVLLQGKNQLGKGNNQEDRVRDNRGDNGGDNPKSLIDKGLREKYNRGKKIIGNQN